MIAAWALLATLSAPQSALDAAQAAFARAEYAQAEALALEQAQPPQQGAALYLVGLARFRAGKPGPALEALDQARSAADPPAPALWHYNRGSCLYQLGRFSEAEADWQQTASLDPTLAGLSLDRGDRDRARELAQRARASASEAALELVADLEAQIASTAESREPAAVAYAQAAGRPAARGGGWDAVMRVAGGYDSDALQTGPFSLEPPGARPTPTPSAMASASLGLSRRLRAGDEWHADLTYAFDQVAYLAPAAQDRSLQLHSFAAALERPLGGSLRAGASISGQLALTGLSAFRGLQGGGGAGVWAALDEGPLLTTRADLEYGRKQGLAEFGWLDGDRFDASVLQQLRLPALALEAGYRFRADLIGALQTAGLRPLPLQACPAGCLVQAITPLGYASNTAWLQLRARPTERLGLELSGGFEHRNYLADDALTLRQIGGIVNDLDRRRRHEQRWLLGAGASLGLSRGLSFTARWDLVVNRSVGDGLSLDPDGHSYERHVFSLGTAYAW
jgi:tetratricopeptide (TPR) repeat protein